MKKGWISEMKKTKRLKLTASQTLIHYWIVLMLLFISALPAWGLAEIYITRTYTGGRTSGELIRASLPFLLVAGLFAFLQYRRLRFREVKVAYAEEQFQEAVERTAQSLKWRIEENSQAFFQAHRPWNWTGSWGEMITIIKIKDGLLFSSICDPDSIGAVASFGGNRQNFQTFLSHLSDVINDRPAEPEAERTVREQRGISTATRIFAYIVCVLLIVLGVFMVLQPLTIRTVFAGLAAIALAGIYLYAVIRTEVLKKGGKAGR